jgi:hypothetical protein
MYKEKSTLFSHFCKILIQHKETEFCKKIIFGDEVFRKKLHKTI